MKTSERKPTTVKNIWKQFGPSLIVFIIAISFALVVLAVNQWDAMAFVRLGTRFSEGDPNGTTGYDGQFVYQIAIDPLGAVPYIDIPAYRYQRILYPLVARWLSLGQPQVIPWMLIALNIVALTTGTYVMSLLLAQNRLSRWYALTVGIFAGQLVSLRLSVNEPFSFAFALLGIYAFETGRPRPGAIFLALAVLSKETALLFVAGYLLYYLIKKQWRYFIEVGLISLTPFIILQAILWITFGEVGVRSGGEGATAFNVIPFGSLLAFGLADPQTLTTVLIMLGPLIILPTVALIVVIIRFFRHHDPIPVALILAFHLFLMVTLPFSTYVDLPGVLRLTSGLVVSTIVFATMIRSRKILGYSTLWIASVAYLRFFV